MSNSVASAVCRLAPLLLLAVVVTGCATQLILPDNEPSALPKLAEDAAATLDFRDDVVSLGPIPATVRKLDRPIRYLSLTEAVAIALENGQTGVNAPSSPGLANEDLLTFTGSATSGADTIRVFALQPAIAATNVDAALAKFDVQAFANQTWRTFDEPVQGLNSFRNGQNATLDFGLAKPLATGGVTGITWATDYKNLTDPPSSVVLNPSYFTRLQFGFEQPLLRDGGVFINQILDSFPSNSLYSISGRSGSQGILIARVRSEQQRAEFERRVNLLLLNVEGAYWRLYAAYIDLYTTDQALRMATEVWRIAKEQFPEKIDEGDYAGTRAQLQFFRGNRLTNIGRILEAERNLRLMLGLRVEDGERLVPIDAPATESYLPDWNDSLHQALTKRPEIAIAREEIRSKQYAVDAQLNRLQPDLRFTATYDLVGLGSRLDGSDQYFNRSGLAQTTNALRSLSGMHYNDWTIGLRFNMPIGFRAEFAGVRQAKLELAQSHYVLKDQEKRAQTFLAKQYSKLAELADYVETQRQQRQALADQLDVRFRKFAAGKIPVDFLQDSVRQWTTALSSEYRAVADYNIAIAAFHYGRGTLMEYDNVTIVEGTPAISQPVNALEHEGGRTRQRLLRCQNRVTLPPSAEKASIFPAEATPSPPELSTLLTKPTVLLPPPPETNPAVTKTAAVLFEEGPTPQLHQAAPIPPLRLPRIEARER